MTMRALIVDDEALARAALSRLLKRDGGITIIGECEDGESAVKAIRQMKPDVVFSGCSDARDGWISGDRVGWSGRDAGDDLRDGL